MALSERTMAVSAVMAAMWLGLGQPAGAQNERLSMRVVVYDYTDADPALLQQAQRVVSWIFGEIEVDTTWLDVAQFTREMPSDPMERRAFVARVIVVSVVPPAMHKALGRKGTVAGGAGLNTRRIWISFSRIQEIAGRERAAASDVLAHVLAHEIAHVLIPGEAHAVTGLMQHNIDPRVIAHNRLSFSAHEAQQIRETLARDRDPSCPCSAARTIERVIASRSRC
jgi:hypothetical protein